MTDFANRTARQVAFDPEVDRKLTAARAEIGTRLIDRSVEMVQLENQLLALRKDQLADVAQLTSLNAASVADWRPTGSLDQETADRPRNKFFGRCPACKLLRPVKSLVCDTMGCDGVGADGGMVVLTIDESTSQV